MTAKPTTPVAIIKRENPYTYLDKHAFWKNVIGNNSFYDLSDVSEGIHINMSDKIATAGSCFAQHIGRFLNSNGAKYFEIEPAPKELTDLQAKERGYGLYTCRYGNIYTARQLYQLIQEAYGERSPTDAVWILNTRYVAALRPTIEPAGFITQQEVIQQRALHLAAVREMFNNLDVFIFTLGHTEAWCS